jgi:hypothetical protein
LLLESKLFFVDCWSRCICIFFDHHIIKRWRWFRTFWHEQINIWVDVLSNHWFLDQRFDFIYSNVIIQRYQRDHSCHADDKFVFLHDNQSIVWFVNGIILNELKFWLVSRFRVNL